MPTLTGVADGHNMQSKTYETPDLYYAAYLCAAGVPMQDAVRKGRRVYFQFADEGQLEDLRKQWFNRKAKVVALQYADEIRSLKNHTHDLMRDD